MHDDISIENLKYVSEISKIYCKLNTSLLGAMRNKREHNEDFGKCLKQT